MMNKYVDTRGTFPNSFSKLPITMKGKGTKRPASSINNKQSSKDTSGNKKVASPPRKKSKAYDWPEDPPSPTEGEPRQTAKTHSPRKPEKEKENSANNSSGSDEPSGDAESDAEPKDKKKQNEENKKSGRKGKKTPEESSDGSEDGKEASDFYPSPHDSDSDRTRNEKEAKRVEALAKARAEKARELAPRPAVIEVSDDKESVVSVPYDDTDVVFPDLAKARKCEAPKRNGDPCQKDVKPGNGKSPWGCHLHRGFIPSVVEEARAKAARASSDRKEARETKAAIRAVQKKKKADGDGEEEDEFEPDFQSSNDEENGGPSRRRGDGSDGDEDGKKGGAKNDKGGQKDKDKGRGKGDDEGKGKDQGKGKEKAKDEGKGKGKGKGNDSRLDDEASGTGFDNWD
ncbi:hypothetical protein VTL71DRAFT_6272 [Oculimacula yallundae]|uniref:Uncharacterized protein n=1 Tax=Oculimacula yallundae TaxID=86028 RepID=A0ABR4BWK6_9HELO